MYERLLLLLFAGILADQLAAQLSPCSSKWMTTDDTGIVYDASMGDGTACSPQLPNTCQGGPNAACTFSFRSYSYICCHDVWLQAGGTKKLYTKSNTEPNAGYEKPQCPYGAISFASGFQALKCNPSSTNGGCPADYACTKSVNQPPKPDPAVAALTPPEQSYASMSPYVCCLKTTLSGTLGSMAKAYSVVGLSPRIVPVAPVGTISELVFGLLTATATPFGFIVHQGDNMSPMKREFTTANTPDQDFDPKYTTDYNAGTPAAVTTAAPGDIFLRGTTLSTSSFTATAKFHVLFFDATSNQDILSFYIDCAGIQQGSAKAAVSGSAEKFAYPPRVNLAGCAKQLSVALGNGGTSGVRTLDSTTNKYWGPAEFDPSYTSKHLISVLVFYTKDVLNATFYAAGGPLDPAATVAGMKFTTVTNFLTKTAAAKDLGSPIAGTYFYV